jgi:S1-C subfamily serine protease
MATTRDIFSADAFTDAKPENAGMMVVSKSRTRCGAPTALIQQSRAPRTIASTDATGSNKIESAQSCVVRLFVDQLRFDWLRPYDASESVEGVGTASVLYKDDESGDRSGDRSGDLYLLTAYHVVQDCERVWASFAPLGKQRFEAQLLGASPQVDAALLVVRGSAMQRVPLDARQRIGCLSLGDSDAVRVNDEVLALGFPMSEFSVWSTKGVIAGRQGTNAHFQIDATINPGNSGGPLVDATGKQIGIVVAGRRDAEGMGYATPISQVRPRIAAIVKALKEKDFNSASPMKPLMITVPSLNAVLGESSDALLRSLSVPEDETGTYVRYVMPDTALSSHLRTGDVMLRVDGCPIDNHGFVQVPWWPERMHVDTLLLNASLGESFQFGVWRDGKPLDFEAVLDEGEQFRIRIYYPQFEEIDYETFGGIVVMALTANHLQSEPSLRARYMVTIADPEVRARSLLVVTDIQSGSSLSGLPLIERGDQVVRVNGRPVTTLDDYRAALQEPMRNESGEWFVRWETRDGQATVLDYATALRETIEFGRKYNYRPSRGTKRVLKTVLNAVEQKQAPAEIMQFAREFAQRNK